MVWDSIRLTRAWRRRDSACWECRSAPPWSELRFKSNRRSAKARRSLCEWLLPPPAAARWLMPEKSATLRILLADDHATVRHGLKLLIDGQPDMKVVAVASDGKAAVQQALELKPDVVVMDISMPDMNGLVATRALKEAQPDAVIVTLTRHADDAYLQELLRAGVSGYVLKRSAPTELLQAIRGVAAGGQYLDSTLTARVTAGFITTRRGRAKKPAATLTD